MVTGVLYVSWDYLDPFSLELNPPNWDISWEIDKFAQVSNISQIIYCVIAHSIPILQEEK